MLMSRRTIFIVKPQGLHVLLSEIQQSIYVFCNSLFNNQMALLFNLNILTGYTFIAKPNKDLEFLRLGKRALA